MTLEEFCNQQAISIWQEGESLEWKTSLGEHKEIVITAAAMANAQGGLILVGINDNGRLLHQQISDSSIKQLTQLLLSNTHERISFSIKTVAIEQKAIILIEVADSPLKPHLAYGRAYLRVGSSNTQMEQSAYHLMLGQKMSGGGADREIYPAASLQDIDEEVIGKFIVLANEKRNANFPVFSDALQVLQNLELINGTALTKGAVLLFGKNPQKFLPQAEIRMALFKDKTHNIFLNQKIAAGNLFTQLEMAMTFLDFCIPTIIDTNLLGNRVQRPLPLKAVQELIANVLVHRDYRDEASAYINVTKDVEIEVSNPGLLPAPRVTPENILQRHPSLPTNRRLARVFFLAGIIEQWGYGAQRAAAEIVAAGHPVPVWESTGGTVRVVVKMAASPLFGET